MLLKLIKYEQNEQNLFSFNFVFPVSIQKNALHENKSEESPGNYPLLKSLL